MKYPEDNIRIIKGVESFLMRPGMYIGKKSINGLAAFIAGSQLSEMVNHVSSDKHLFNVDWREFEEWVMKKTKKKLGSIRSFGIALLITENDEEKAFDLWISWYKEFNKMD